MKKYYTILAALVLSIGVFAQSPEKMSYQAVIRDGENNLVTDTQIGMQISILQGDANGSAVYTETQLPTTNANGLVSIEIGAGATSDDFSAIDWASGPYFVKTETDPAGGTTYTITGTSQLLSVPYALHAKTADGVSGTIDESDPVFDASVAKGITETDTMIWNNKIDADVNAVADDLITFDGTNWVSRGALIGNSGGSQAQNNMQPWIAVNYIIALVGIYPSRSSIADPTIAEISMFAGNFAPRNWAFCDGQLLSVASNSALFSLVGTIYGGDGRTTFALPNMRGRTAIHAGNGPGLTPRTIGQIGGSETNTMTINQLPSHTHTITYQ
jgi:microcystin-dependent protein